VRRDANRDYSGQDQGLLESGRSAGSPNQQSSKGAVDSEAAPDWIFRTVGFWNPAGSNRPVGRSDAIEESEGPAVFRPEAAGTTGKLPAWLLKAAGLTGDSIKHSSAPGTQASYNEDLKARVHDENAGELLDNHQLTEEETMGEADELEKGQDDKIEEGRQDGEEPEDEALKWLEDLASEPGVLWDESQAEDKTEPAADTDLSAGTESSPGPESPDAQESAGEAEDDDLSWLDQIAAGAGAAIDEPPTMEWAEELPDEQPQPDAEPENDLSWLDELEQELGPPSASLSDQEAKIIPGEASSVEPEALVDDMPDDPDEVIDWLEILAKEQVPLDSEFLADEIVDEELATTLAELEDLEMPTDPDEALSWLEELADQTPVASEGFEVVLEPDTPPQPQDVVAARVMAEMLFAEQEAAYDDGDQEVTDEDGPEASQEIISWLEELAARQEKEAEADEEAGGPAIGEEALVAGAAVLAAKAISERDEVLPEQVVDDSGPDWLIQDMTAETDEGDLDWMDTLEDLEADDLLGHEDVAVGEVLVITTDELEPDTPSELELPPFLVDEGEAEESEDVDETLSTESESKSDSDRVASATAAVQAGDIDQALVEFSTLLEESEDVTPLIESLENTVDDVGPNTGLTRLLGDAYAKQGDFEKALEQYRQAMDNQ
jgi:pilus assembly protein FimV